MKVKDPRPNRVRTVLLTYGRNPTGADFPIGTIPKRKRARRFKVPGSITPGQYFVNSCAGANCRVAAKKLVVKKRPPKFRLRYVHIGKANRVRQRKSQAFIGRDVYRRNMRLKAKVPIRGKKGVAPIRYLKSKYVMKQVGRFGSPSGPAGSAAACVGRDVSKVVNTTGGKARVLRLKVQGRKVALDFRPGPAFGGGNPSERIRRVSEYESGGCSDYRNASTGNIFLSGIGGFYTARNWLKDPSGTGQNQFVRLNRGWKVFPRKKKGFAKLNVRGKLDGQTTWIDRFVIDRLR